MLLASTAHRRAPWAGLNAMTRVLEPNRRTRRDFAPDRTLRGLGVLVLGLAAMSVVYEAALARHPRRRGMVSGSLFALSGYALDRWLMPKQLLRDFERNMGPTGTFAKYAAIALGATAPTR